MTGKLRAVFISIVSSLICAPAAQARDSADLLRRHRSHIVARAAAPQAAEIAQARAQIEALRAGLARDRRAAARAMQSGATLAAAVAVPPATPQEQRLSPAQPAIYRAAPVAPLINPDQSRISRLFDLIARAEAGPAQYDAIHYRARIRPVKTPSTMSLGEILAWIEATPNQQHAIGRYQIIPATLRYLMRAERLGPETLYSPETQDRLALRLIQDAGLDGYLTGLTPPGAFMNNLAYVWAGLPLSNGQSAYRGIAGNKATLTRAEYERAFLAIYPPPPLLIGILPASPPRYGDPIEP